MEKKTKIFIWILFIITFISIYLIYNRSFISYDYEIIPLSEDESYE